MTSVPPGPRRGRYALAAVGAGAVAVVFATIGDGVDVPGATGLRRLVIEGGHQLVWALLAAAFVIAAARGRWSPIAQAMAVAAGVVYAVFLFAVFVWP